MTRTIPPCAPPGRRIATPRPRRRPAAPPPTARRAAPAALAALLALAGCNPHLQGNGVFHEETRSVAAFEGVSAQDGIIVTATAGQAQAVVVSGDENVVLQVQTRVRTDASLHLPVLEVWVSGGEFSSVHPLRVDVAVPALRLLRASEATPLDARDVAAEAIDVQASDGSLVRLSGAGGTRLFTSLSGGQHGGAQLDARAYPVSVAEVALTGGARAELRASEAVTGTAEPGSQVENLGAGACQVTDGAGQPVSCAAQ